MLGVRLEQVCAWGLDGRQAGPQSWEPVATEGCRAGREGGLWHRARGTGG